MDLQIATITTNNGGKYSLLRNIPQEVLGTKEIDEIYKLQWRIETNYNKIKKTEHILKITLKKDEYISKKTSTANSSNSTFSTTTKIKFIKLIKNKQEQQGDYR